jgi:hypothetical protein
MSVESCINHRKFAFREGHYGLVPESDRGPEKNNVTCDLDVVLMHTRRLNRLLINASKQRFSKFFGWGHFPKSMCSQKKIPLKLCFNPKEDIRPTVWKNI